VSSYAQGRLRISWRNIGWKARTPEVEHLLAVWMTDWKFGATFHEFWDMSCESQTIGDPTFEPWYYIRTPFLHNVNSPPNSLPHSPRMAALRDDTTSWYTKTIRDFWFCLWWYLELMVPQENDWMENKGQLSSNLLSEDSSTHWPCSLFLYPTTDRLHQGSPHYQNPLTNCVNHGSCSVVNSAIAMWDAIHRKIS